MARRADALPAPSEYRDRGEVTLEVLVDGVSAGSGRMVYETTFKRSAGFRFEFTAGLRWGEVERRSPVVIVWRYGTNHTAAMWPYGDAILRPRRYWGIEEAALEWAGLSRGTSVYVPSLLFGFWERACPHLVVFKPHIENDTGDEDVLSVSGYDWEGAEITLSIGREDMLLRRLVRTVRLDPRVSLRETIHWEPHLHVRAETNRFRLP